MLDRLARFLHRRRRPVLAGAFVLVIVAGVIGGPVAGLLQSDDDFDPPAAEAVQAREAIATATGASASPDVIALVRLGAPAGSAAGQAKLGEVVAAARGPEVARVDAYAPGGPRELVSRDGRSSYVAVSLRDGADSETLVERLERVPAVTLGGPEVINEQAGAQVEEDLARAELLAFPLLFLVSLVVFRGVVAALLPLFVGMITVLSTFLPDARGQRDRGDERVRAEPDHRPGAGPGDRLLALRRVPLPRGARAAAWRRRTRCRRRCGPRAGR